MGWVGKDSVGVTVRGTVVKVDSTECLAMGMAASMADWKRLKNLEDHEIDIEPGSKGMHSSIVAVEQSFFATRRVVCNA